MSNKVKINGKKPAQEPELMTVSDEDRNQFDAIADTVRGNYAEQEELETKMLELARVHITAHSESIDFWDAKMAEAVDLIERGRRIYTGAWEGKLLWLERAAGVMRVDIARSADHGDGAIRLYWADTDGNILLTHEGEPEVTIDTFEHLQSMCMRKAPEEVDNGKG